MTNRRYAPREKWQRIQISELTEAALREGAENAAGQVEAFRVDAIDGDRPVSLEVLWMVQSRRAAVATPDDVFWTDAPAVETAVHRWAGDVPRGTRNDPR